jgi:hypothetical protein
MEDFGILYGHLIHFATIWYILWPLGIFNGYLVNFSRFGMSYQENSGNPDRRMQRRRGGEDQLL